MSILSVECDGDCRSCDLSVVEVEDDIEVINCKAEKKEIPVRNHLKEAFEEDDEEDDDYEEEEEE